MASNDEVLQHLRVALELELHKTRGQLRTDRQAHDDAGADQGVEVVDPGERATMAGMGATDAQLNTQHLRKALEIEAALHRLATGHYGLCADCGEPIAAQRLQAYPQCLRCRGCQQAHELAQALAPGTHSAS